MRDKERSMIKRTMKAAASGSLEKYGLPFDCYVLEDGRRVVSQRGILRGLLGPDGPKKGDLGRYIASLPSKNKALSTDPIEFVPPRGGPALGRETPFVIAFLRAYTEAHRAGKLHASQIHLAHAAGRMLEALAGVGLDALIDEVTGFQKKRSADYLGTRLELYLRTEEGEYKVLWNQKLMRSICKLYGWEVKRKCWPPQSAGLMRWIYELALGKDVVEEMRARSNEVEGLEHPWLTEGPRRMLEKDLIAVDALAESSNSRSEFRDKIRFRFRGTSYQTKLFL